MLTKDTKLRFWCQKVLPLVYDDSLSYYELLNKVVGHLNKHTEDINALIDFYNTFAEDVEEIIQQMMEDGDFNEIVADTIGSLIAEEYDPNETYIIFNYCIFEGKLYRANGSTTGVFDPEKWDERTVGYDLATIQNYIYTLNAGNVAYDPNETYDNDTVGKELLNLTIPNNLGVALNTNVSIADIEAGINKSGITSLFLNEPNIYVGRVNVISTFVGNIRLITLLGGNRIITLFSDNNGSTWTQHISPKTEIDTAINNTIAKVETGTTATKPYYAGEYVVVGGQLYRVITAISSGGTFTPDTNIVATTIGVDLTDVSNRAFVAIQKISIPSNGSKTLTFSSNGLYSAFIFYDAWNPDDYWGLQHIGGYTPSRGKVSTIIQTTTQSVTISFNNGVYTFSNSNSYPVDVTVLYLRAAYLGTIG